MAVLKEYKCPACGGAIEFDSSSQKMKCPYCDTEFEIDALKAYEDSVSDEKPDEMVWETQAGGQWQEGETDSMRVYTCQSCGGEIVADETMGASSCPFCGNPVIMTEAFAGSLKPDYVIPFKRDKKAAKKAYEEFISGKPLLPKVFKEQNHIDEIKGIYVPFWLFEADAHGNIRYKATRTRVWSDKDYNYTRTSFYAVFREGDVGFVNVPVDGSSKMPDDMMESIEPFDFKEAVDFQTAYLAGYMADKYDVTADESIGRANDRVRESTQQAFRQTISGYDSVIPEHVNIALKNGKAKYALYPVWMLNTTWKGKQFTFAMNGQTGKMTGDLPVDKKAYMRWLGMFTAGFSLLAYVVFWLIHII